MLTLRQAIQAFRLFTGIEPDLSRLHCIFAIAATARDAAVTEAV
jgi:shikimate 5-dehydrogenase